MFLGTDDLFANISKAALVRALTQTRPEEPCLEERSIPQEYFCMEGFKLTEKPSQTYKVFFLGDLGRLGAEKIKLGPKLEWLFHESDKVVINLSGGICFDKARYSKDKNAICAHSFFDFCSQIMPEKTIFNFQHSFFEGRRPSIFNESLKAVFATGADAFGIAQSGYKTLEGDLRIAKRGRETIVGDKSSDLMLVKNESEAPLPIQMSGKMLVARSLGSFCAPRPNVPGGLAAQVEFARYDQWQISKVHWQMVNLRARSGVKLVY